MKVKNVLSWNISMIQKEVNTQPSCTIPDQAMSIKEIMDRFARGLPMKGNIPIYEDQETLDQADGINFETLDLSEQHEIIMQRQNELLNLKLKQRESEKRKYEQSIIKKYEASKPKETVQLATDGNVSGKQPV